MYISPSVSKKNSRASVLKALLKAYTRLVLQTATEDIEDAHRVNPNVRGARAKRDVETDCRTRGEGVYAHIHK